MALKIHIVQSGDSMWKIAKNYGVELDKLIQANPEIKDPNKISPGDKINIPGVMVQDKPVEPSPGEPDRDRPPGQVIFQGRMSTFGGPDDQGVGPDEGLALVTPKNLKLFGDVLLPEQPPGTTGLARRLDPEKFYLACRWNYTETPKDILAKSRVHVANLLTGTWALARPVDYGPALWTGRVADLSPGLARYLGLDTDDEVEVKFSPQAPIITPEPAEEIITKAPDRVFTVPELMDHFGRFSYQEDYSQPGAWIKIDPTWVKDNIIRVHISCLEGVVTYGNTIFSGLVPCHRKVADDLKAAFNEIEEKGLKKLILFWTGSLAPRHIDHNRSKPLSSHSWGVAVDINHQWNPYGGTPAPKGSKGSVKELVPIFEKYGFYWGGNFSTRDGMHFEYARVPA
jgi:spore coat assembly protein SafA